ncbi:MAG: UDP-3-O-[3-hydroxymyristoyl] N-acetylglucosamine deacetylase [Gemmatimonadetes bacterium]|nr:UDP-3-O-[3-hydroxymyristoyl] N-acetylglucosamine deacetylase [Gemmatimonadota bacterium]
MSRPRRTIARRAEVAGVGLHLGHPCRLAFVPAASGAGIGFVRSDRPERARVAADAANAVLTERRTQLGEGADAIHTVEHVLAAVAGLGIDDVTIELDAPEPPIADGSAAPFVTALREAGIVEHAGTADVLALRHAIRIEDGESRYEAHPAGALEVNVTIAFPHPMIGTQAGTFAVTPTGFSRELAPARTFGFVHEVEALRARGLIQGASIENAVVLDDRDVVSGPLRWPDEFLRHKALDVVGDLALAGRRVQARIVAHRPSHRGTVQLVRALHD